MKEFKRSEKVQELIARMTLPRVQISIILGLTAAAAFFSSTLMLRIGVTSMAVRYPLVVAVGYGAFLLLLKVWLWTQRYGSPADLYDALDDGDSDYTPGGGSSSSWTAFHGSSTSGGGGEWTSSASSPGGSGGIDLDVGLDGDDLGLIVLAIAAALAAALAIFYVIYIAPVLLAEVLLDGLIAAALYRKFKNVEQRYWLTTAIKKTIIPAILVAVLLGVAGWLMQMAVPEAKSVGGVVRRVMSRPSS